MPVPCEKCRNELIADPLYDYGNCPHREGLIRPFFDGQALSDGKVVSLAGGYCVAVYRCLCGREQTAQCEGFGGGLSEEAARSVGWNKGDRGWMCPFCSGETDKLFQVFGRV